MLQNFFQRQIQFLDVLLEESSRSTELFLEKLQKIHLEQKTKTDQKTLVPDNVEKAPWFLFSFNFPPEKGKNCGIFRKEINLKKNSIRRKNHEEIKNFYRINNFRCELVALLMVLSMIQDGNV